MGGCATKPKVLMTDAGETPQPPPETAKEEAKEEIKEEEVAVAARALPEAKEVVVVQEEAEKKVEGDGDEEGDKVKEIVDDDKVDEQGSKRRSLSLLFKENEEGKDLTESDDTPSEPRKQELPETEKPSKESETILPQVEKPEKSEILVEVAPTPVFANAPEKLETEKVIELETEKVIEPEKPETEKAIEPAVATEKKSNETPEEEKKTEAAK